MAADGLLAAVEAAEAAAVERVRAAQLQRRADIPVEAPFWLALAPLWTADLAGACELPRGSLEPSRILERLEEEGLCRRSEVRAAPRVEDGTFVRSERIECFTMPADVRDGVLEEAVADRQLEGVRTLMATIGERLRAAGESGLALPGRLPEYAELAALAEDPSGMARALEARVNPLLDEERLAEALTWIRAARGPAELLKGTLELATDRGARRLELAQRLADDRRALERFVERREAMAAFQRLRTRDAKDPRWALHFIGDGGVGKTMLMTHIKAQAGDEYATARVDFDYLSPDYPTERPALLLEELADDLRLHAADQEATRAFADFDAAAERLAATDGGGTAGQAVTDSSFRELLALFGDALQRLPQPIVLLIDTCEELARLRPDGTIPDSVRFTFEDVLDPLHDQVKNLSVVFSGRRTLAYKGGGWHRLPMAGDGSRRQPERAFLRLHELRGFDRDEAETYLCERADVRPHLVQSILDRALEEQPAETRFRWDDPAEGPEDELRYRPFELNRLAAWARADPELTLERLDEEQGDSAYVATRIVQRIHHDVLRQLLPGMALLGRFDRPQLAMAWGGDEDDAAFGSAAAELAELEWIKRDAKGTFMLERGLRDSMLAWAGKNVRADLAAARRRLVAGLWERTTDPDHRPPLAYFEAELALLDAAPARALEWWRAVEESLTDDASLPWLVRLCESALAREDLSPTMRAAVRATLAAARLLVNPGPEAVFLWTEAELALEDVPGASPAERARALAGQVAASRHGASPASERLLALAEAWRELPGAAREDERLLAGLAAAADATLEHAETSTWRGRPSDLRPLFDVIPPSGPPEIAGFLLTLQARFLRLAGDDEGARKAHGAALRTAPPPGPTTRRWLDWRPPDDVGSRVRLEYAASPVFASTQVLDRLGSELPSGANTIEARFLCSMLLERIRAVRPAAPHEIARLREALDEVRLDAPSCNVHGVAGPLFAAVAIAMAETGEVASALELLESHGLSADSIDDGGAVARHADRASLRIARLMRLTDERPWRTLESATSPELRDFEGLTVLDGLAGRRRIQRFSWAAVPDAPINEEDWAAWRHAHWRALYAIPDDLAEAAVHWAAIALAHERHAGGVPAARSACRLDAHEANLVADRIGMPSPCPAFGAEPMRLEEIRDPLDRLRLRLRASALASADPDDSIAADVELVGGRAAGLIALSEGEMLALRLPAPAVRLLRFAGRMLGDCDDHVGTFIAGTATAMAAIRAGDDASQVRETIDALSPEAERFGVPDSVEELGDSHWTWRPWLARHLACRAWLPGAGRRRVRAVETWVEEHYGSPPGPVPDLVMGRTYRVPSVAVPAELEGWATEHLPRSNAVSRSSRWLGMAIAIFGVLGGAVALVTVAASAGVSLTASRYLVIPLGIAAYVFAALAATRAWLVYATNHTPVVVDFLPVVQDVKGLRSGPQTALATLRRRSPLLLGLPATDTVGLAWIESDISGLELIARRLTRLRRWTGGRPLPLRLRIERSVAEGPWESILAAALGDPGEDGSLGFRTSRTTERETSVGASGAPLSVVTFSSDFAEDDMARQGWAKLPHRLGQLGDSGAQALHLIGTPKETRSGWRLEIAPVVARWSLDVRDRLPADAIVRLLPGQRVCVLQATPIDHSRGLPNERDQAAGLRALAGELFTLGIEAVITIPPLSARLGTAVLSELAASLVEQRKATENLPEGVTAARQAVLGSPDVAPSARAAVAFDICAYVRLKSDGRVARDVTVGSLRST